MTTEQKVVESLLRKLSYLQRKAKAHERRAALRGLYKVAIMQRAAQDTYREIKEILYRI